MRVRGDSLYWGQHLRRKGPGIVLGLIILTLSLLGLIILFSAGHGTAASSHAFAKKQLVWLLLALFTFWAVQKVDFEKARRFWPLILAFSLIPMILVLIPGVGHEVNGARRWIRFGPMGAQVSDFAKMGFVFLLAHYLAKEQREIACLGRGFLYPAAGVIVFCVLLLLQPDYGTTALFAAVAGAMMFLAGCRLIYLVPSGLLGGGLFGLAVYLDPVRLKRILSFLDVEGNRSDGAYQLWQGILAFGSGGVHGVGLGNGRQQRAYMPEAHTDFIFPVIGEELGLIFTLLVVGLFAGFFLLLLLRLRRAPNLFQFNLVAGCGLMIVLQALINLGVATGCLPTKGMSLPFVSYGGSNLVTMFLLAGILANAFRRWERSPFTHGREVMA